MVSVDVDTRNSPGHVKIGASFWASAGGAARTARSAESRIERAGRHRGRDRGGTNLKRAREPDFSDNRTCGRERRARASLPSRTAMALLIVAPDGSSLQGGLPPSSRTRLIVPDLSPNRAAREPLSSSLERRWSRLRLTRSWKTWPAVRGNCRVAAHGDSCRRNSCAQCPFRVLHALFS